jgi:hypothetical protein
MPESTYSLIKLPDGTVKLEGTLSPAVVASVGAINWTALLQAIMAAMPAIIAIIQAFQGNSPPVPPPPATK